MKPDGFRGLFPVVVQEVEDIDEVGIPGNNMGVSKNRGKKPKMDGENNGKPY